MTWEYKSPALDRVGALDRHIARQVREDSMPTLFSLVLGLQ
ncbi:hypothetical protein ACW73I_01105 [Methylomonas sp. MgM2]